jgi:hypothetical protein
MSTEIWAGEPLHAGGRTIVPFSRVARLRLPFARNFSLVWNRPAAVIVSEGSGDERVLPISDLTRQVQVSILIFGLAASLLLWAVFRKRTSSD